MTDYRFLEDASVVRIDDGATIPNDPDNNDWRAFEAWRAAGGVADPFVPPTILPTSISKLGLIRALRESGAWTTVKAAIAADEVMQEDWEAAQEIRRTDPLTQAMIMRLSLTEPQVDALMIRAAELVA